MDQKGGHIKIIFDYFQIQKWMLRTVTVKKVDEKNEVICLVSVSPSWVMIYKLSKKVHFLQFCADLSKKSRSVKAIYIYASESSHYTLSETVSHSIINNTIFWKYATRPFRWIYVNCFNSLRFLADASTKLQKKCTFLYNLRNITQERNMETRQMTSFLSSTSSDLTVYNINF